MFAKHFHLVFGLFIMLTAFIHLGSTTTISPSPVTEKIHTVFVRTGEFLELHMDNTGIESKDIRFEWSDAEGNLLEEKKAQLQFLAPLKPGKISLSCRKIIRKQVVALSYFEISVYRQIVVLKADDLVYTSPTIFPHNWNLYFNLVDSLNIKGSAGIIGNSLENAPQAYYDKIKEWHRKGNMEFWNHGYTHALNFRNAQGELSHEFRNSGYEMQHANLNRTQELGKQKLGITFRVFGAPGNGIDQVTHSLIDQHPDIAAWFYGDSGSAKSILKRNPAGEIEYPVLHPNFGKFLANYTYSERFLTIQFHPTPWTQQEFNDFKRMLVYLCQQEVTFMTPTEFALSFYPELIKDKIEAEIML